MAYAVSDKAFRYGEKNDGIQFQERKYLKIIKIDTYTASRKKIVFLDDTFTICINN